MALIPIMGQPINLVPNNERDFGCEPNTTFCALYSKDEGETITVQMIQTPCDASLVANGTFINDSSWTFDANIVISGQKATHIVGTSGEIYQDIYGALIAGDYVSVAFTVTGMSGGSIEVHVGETAATYTITENGIYTFYVKPDLDDTLLKFVFSADCDGAISDISSFDLYRESDLVAYLLDSSGVVAWTLTTILLKDRIVFSIPTFLITEGCYTIQVFDPCTIALTTLTERFTDVDFDNAGDWTVTTNSGTADVSGSNFNMITGATTPARATALQPFNIPQGSRLYAELSITMAGFSPSADVQMGIFIEDGGDTIDLMRITAPFGLNTIRRVWDIGYPPAYTNMGVFIEDSSGGIGVDNHMTSVSLKTALVSSVDGIFESNCIKIASDVSGTKYIKGYADEVAAYPLPNKSLGFLFHRDIFFLQARLPISFLNPHNTIKTENNLYSNGRSKKAFAQITKAWDLHFLEADENMHDTISNIINCDQFTIEGNEYITSEKEYAPNWNAKSQLDVTDSKVEVSKVDGTRFNTNV